MTALIIAILFTLLVSAICSLLEAMILSTTTSDTEALKNRHPKAGRNLERFRSELEKTSSAILALNTIANTLGATLVGGLATRVYGEASLAWFSIGMTIGILVFSEVIPKNVGVIYRTNLQPLLIPILSGVRTIMFPVSWLCKHAVQLVLPKRATEEVSGEEIRLLAEKSAQEGNLSPNERNMITNALSLDEIKVEDIMTPRTVVMALEKAMTVGEVFSDFQNIAFARLPVFEDTIDNIVGIARRKDLLAAKANDEDSKTVGDLMKDPLFVSENHSASDALKVFLGKHQQLAIVVDEWGSVVGVVTMEDIIEQIIGAEIFEADDLAVDMREFAMRRSQGQSGNGSPAETGSGGASTPAAG